MEEADKIKKLIRRNEVRTIIEFIRNNEGTTMDNVADKLKQENISSRLTTLKVIEALIQLGVIIDDRKGNYSHRLRYNKDFEWDILAMDYFISTFEEMKDTISILSENKEIGKSIEEVGHAFEEMVRKVKQSKKKWEVKRVKL
jgi:hypothetical protein